jgi:glyoxylase-like metal-dependent hydrolase (beta-lactamase superfamily II)
VRSAVDSDKPGPAEPAPVTITNLAAGTQGFTSNAFLVAGDRTVLVDPGDEFDVAGSVRDRSDGLDAVVLTHTHPDHVGNVPAVVDAFDVDVWGFDPDSEYVDHAIADEGTVRLGDHDYRALHTPGHKDDHLCFHAPASGVLFAGDLIFANGGFGRTDLEEGDRTALIRCIERVREAVGEDLAELHAGHGPSVTTDAYAHVELAARAARRG